MAATTSAAGVPRRRRRYSLLTRQDKIVLGLAVGIPAFIHISLVWIPTISSVILSFTSWNGIGGLDQIKFVGVQNYVNLFTVYPPFWPALQHNLVWLGVFLFRFFQISQFKRSCVPNAPKVGSGGSLSPRGDWRAPSDSEARAWLAELDLVP